MSSISKDILHDEFELFGEEIDEDFFYRLQEMCLLYRLDEAGIAREWMAFKCSEGITSLTVSTMESFEREWLPKKLQKTPKSSKHVMVANTNIPNRIGDEDVDIFSMYADVTPKGNKRYAAPDERETFRKRLVDSERNSPTATPINTPSIIGSRSEVEAESKSFFLERSCAGQVVASWGPTDKLSSRSTDKVRCEITPFSPRSLITKQYPYMFQKTMKKACVLNDRIEEIADLLLRHHNLEDFCPLQATAQDTVHVFGSVACDCLGRLNRHSVLLEGPMAASGVCLPVDLSGLDSYSLFPGQVVVADSVNPSGGKLHLKKIYPAVEMQFPEFVGNSEPDGTSLRVVVAAGPFSASDNLLYEPLQVLLEEIGRDCPDVCFLVGPFVDVKNLMVEDGKTGDSYGEIFTRCMEMIAHSTRRDGCQVVIVPSARDVHHHPVYPQGPFLWEDHSQYQHMHMVSDPCTLRIGNIVFGVMSTDILFHISAEEVSHSLCRNTDRLSLLLQHLFDQRSYYPLYPTYDGVNADVEQFENCVHMSAIPHVLICPSDLHYFIKNIIGCCCVNPGRITKGQSGGTYARIHLPSPTCKQPHSIAGSSAVEIVRI